MGTSRVRLRQSATWGVMSERNRRDAEEPGHELRLFVTNEGSLSRLHVGGEIDMASAPALGERLELLIQSGTGDVEVDMSDVTYCDSTGLAALVLAYNSLRARDRVLRVIDPSVPVERLLRIVRLEHLTAGPT